MKFHLDENRPFMTYMVEGLERRLLLSSAVQLAFERSPAGGTTGTQVAAVVVEVEDADGAVVSSNTSAITLTLNGGTFAAGGNKMQATAVNGIATLASF